jgi:hypothetical protein
MAMLRFAGVLLLTATTVQAGELTLACEGTQTSVQYGKAEPIITKLVVDVADESVTWEGYRAALDPGPRQNHTLRFKWKHDENCQEASAAPAGEPSCESYSFTGTLNRASGKTSILYTHHALGSQEDATNPEDTVKYELRCEPAKSTF